MKIDIKYVIGFLGAVVLLVIGLGSFRTTPVAVGSVQDGQGYNSTSTPFVGIVSGTKVIRSTPGILGSVVVTSTQTGNFQLYDATTSDITLRTGGVATSSLLIADFPAGLSTSTYIYDIILKNGLLYVNSGTVSSSTITSK